MGGRRQWGHRSSLLDKGFSIYFKLQAFARKWQARGWSGLSAETSDFVGWAERSDTHQRRYSWAMALRLTSCSSRRTALLPPSPSRSFASLGLSASTAAPEPHDFAVRSSCTRQSQLSRPSHLTARS